MIWLIPVVILYCLLMIRWSWAWNKISIPVRSEDKQQSVTVITAMRNESGRIASLIGSLADQDYPFEWYFILVDDHSTDDSSNEAKNALADTTIKATILTLPENRLGKKAAINYGIQNANTEWVLTTDADCIMNESWITEMMRSVDDQTQMISGPVQFLQRPGFLNKFIELDLISMIGIGAATIQTGTPLLNNAANMGFRRSVFLEIDPFSESKKASGDDIFLLKSLHRKYPGSIKFVKSSSAIVSSIPPESFTEFFHQRVRWASKTSSTLTTIKEAGIIVLIYITNFISLLVPGLAILYGSRQAVLIALGILALKILADQLFFSAVVPFFGRRKYLKYAPLAQILHIPYVVLFGLSGIYGSYQWKSRKLQ